MVWFPCRGHCNKKIPVIKQLSCVEDQVASEVAPHISLIRFKDSLAELCFGWTFAFWRTAISTAEALGHISFQINLSFQCSEPAFVLEICVYCPDVSNGAAQRERQKVLTPDGRFILISLGKDEDSTKPFCPGDDSQVTLLGLAGLSLPFSSCFTGPLNDFSWILAVLEWWSQWTPT